MNLLRQWWDRQNERDAVKKGVLALSKQCMEQVRRALPDARHVRARAVWYGDQTRSAITWTDANGQKHRWGIYQLFWQCRGRPAEREALIARSLDLFLNPVASDEDDEEEDTPRTAQQVAQRLLALLAVVWRANEKEDIAQKGLAWARAHGIDAFFSEAEKAFMVDERPQQQAIIDLGWRAEAMLPMVWGLRGIAALPPSNQRADPWKIPLVQQAMKSPAEFVANARHIAADDVSEEECRLVDEHWYVHDARLRRQPVPSHLDAGIVHERRYALSWMVGRGKNWDQVPTDT